MKFASVIKYLKKIYPSLYLYFISASRVFYKYLLQNLCRFENGWKIRNPRSELLRYFKYDKEYMENKKRTIYVKKRDKC